MPWEFVDYLLGYYSFLIKHFLGILHFIIFNSNLVVHFNKCCRMSCMLDEAIYGLCLSYLLGLISSSAKTWRHYSLLLKLTYNVFSTTTRSLEGILWILELLGKLDIAKPLPFYPSNFFIVCCLSRSIFVPTAQNLSSLKRLRTSVSIHRNFLVYHYAPLLSFFLGSSCDMIKWVHLSFVPCSNFLFPILTHRSSVGL